MQVEVELGLKLKWAFTLNQILKGIADCLIYFRLNDSVDGPNIVELTKKPILKVTLIYFWSIFWV